MLRKKYLLLNKTCSHKFNPITTVIAFSTFTVSSLRLGPDFSEGYILIKLSCCNWTVMLIVAGANNFFALDHPREKDGARLQMRLSYSPASQFLLFLVQWTDCNLAGALGLLSILIYLTYADGKTTMSVQERKASIREFYVIFPSILQLQGGITDVEDRKQKEVCAMRYRRKDELEKGKLSEFDIEREEECGICMEMNNKVVLPNCSHSLCLKCYRDCIVSFALELLNHLSRYYRRPTLQSQEWRSFDWHGRSQSCPFCRGSLKRVNSGDLWIFADKSDVVDLTLITRQDCKRLFMYIDKLPLIIPDTVYMPHDSHLK
ncbi:hypothetical protein SADUNF_Sadunf09G0035400 [Salix dunnii]|uniref:RING-type domain-containing protein n=1 Tax=Salix dunnii TaxID=1413687 RepID=A0A835JVH8_9ROSI|nr:hypothetical protein SADUNF_Sadunf09G0035400 [Salix dunnii]